MKLSSSKGFTVIEVIIVLVIGAVIMLAVFLVVPQLQQSARNNQRKNDARRFMALIIQYYEQNGYSTVRSPSTIINATLGDYNSSFLITGEPSVGSYAPATRTSAQTVANATSSTRMFVNYGSKCDGQNVVKTSLENYNIAISVFQESATYSCISNN